MTPEGVRLVMNGWLENQSQLVLVGQLFGFAFALPCRVEALTGPGVQLSTKDGGRIAVGLWESGVEFRYAEPREFPAIEASSGLTAAQKIASSVSVLFPSRGLDSQDDPGPEPEMVSFMELID